ncbi:MAG TPA: hypothetical protein VGX23_10555 [Actinocrinis sp.]|nr:hypothetical protein [Actinocrinis sp.]
MLTRPRRLMVWGGAAVVIVAGAPVAYAPAEDAQTAVRTGDSRPATQNTNEMGTGTGLGNGSDALPGKAIAPEGGDGS